MNVQRERPGAVASNSISGPYESWMLEFGKFYDLPALGLQTSPFRTHVAEITGATTVPAHLFADDFQLGDDKNGVRIPPLWDDGGTFHLSFFPFVGFTTNRKDIDPDLVAFRDYSFDDIAELGELFTDELEARLGHFSHIAEQRSGAASAHGEGQMPKPAFDPETPIHYRLNYPIVRSAYDPRPVKWRVPDLGFGKLQSPVPASRPPSLVVTAIIDDGIPFAHSNFLVADKSRTRIDFCWSQGAAAGIGGNTGEGEENDTTTVLFGREFTSADINGMLQRYDGNEDAIYGAAGLLSTGDSPLKPLSRMHSHGAHVLDSLTGNWPQSSEAQCRIIAVDLPSSASWDTSGFGTDMFVLSAMHYVFRRTDDIERAFNEANGTNIRARLVVNLSYGFSGGPHDGSNLIEAALHEMIEQRRLTAPTSLVMPSGNTFMGRLHSVVLDQHFTRTETGADVATLRWMLPADDRTSSFLELWLPEDLASDALEVSVETPDGLKCSLSGLEANSRARSQMGIQSWKDIISRDALPIGRLTLDTYRAGKERFMIALAPTAARFADNLPSAPCGEWTIRLTKMNGPEGISESPMKPVINADTDPKAGGIQCFIQRDVSFGQGNTGARQSYFVDDQDEPYNPQGGFNQVDSVAGLKPHGKWIKDQKAKLRRFGSINGMATAGSTMVAGGYVEATNAAPAYSGARALRYTSSSKVKRLGKGLYVSAVTDRSQWQAGIVAAGTRSGITVALQGTSSAAPQVARKLAEAMLLSDLSDEDWKREAETNYRSLLDLLEVPKVTSYPTAHPASKDRLGEYFIRRPRTENPDDKALAESVRDSVEKRASLPNEK